MNTRLKFGTILAGAALALTTIGGAANASNNLLTNGDLLPTTAGWTVSGEGTFKSIPGVGARLTATEATKEQTSAVAFQCVEIEQGYKYTLAGSQRLPADQERSGFAFYLGRFYAGQGCGGDLVDQQMSSHFQQMDGWQTLDMPLDRHNGLAAKSLQISLVVTKNPSLPFKKDGTFAATFKNLSLTGGPSGGVTCVAFGGDCGEDEEPGGGAACDGTGCGEEDEPAAPAGPACEVGVDGCGDKPAGPTSTPTGPSVTRTPAPSTTPVPGSSSTPRPGATSTPPSGNPSGPSAGGGNPTGDSPDTTPGGNANGIPGSATGGGSPAQGAPTLEPQGPGLPNATTPTPAAPATGGDNPSDPAGGLSSNEPGGDHSTARSDAGQDDGSLAIPFIAAPLLLLAAGTAIGIRLRRTRP